MISLAITLLVALGVAGMVACLLAYGLSSLDELIWPLLIAALFLVLLYLYLWPMLIFGCCAGLWFLIWKRTRPGRISRWARVAGRMAGRLTH